MQKKLKEKLHKYEHNSLTSRYKITLEGFTCHLKSICSATYMIKEKAVSFLMGYV